MIRAWIVIMFALASYAQTSVTLNGNSYTVQEGPIGFFDGPCDAGTWSNGADYHSLQAVLHSGAWYRAIKESGPGKGGAITPGTDGTVWVSSTLSFSGSGAKFTCLLWKTTGNGRAQAGNPAYVAMKAGADAEIAAGYSTAAGADIAWHATGLSSTNTFASSFNCALAWASAGAPDSSTYLDCALSAIRNVEDFEGGAALCDESQSQCGSAYYQTYIDNGSYYFPFLASVYTLVRDKLTPTERTKFMNLVWNDLDNSHNGLGTNGAPTVGCTKKTFKTTSGTISVNSWADHIFSGASIPSTLAVVGVGTHFLAELAVGDIIFETGHVASIADDTHLQLTAPSGNTQTNATLQGLVVSAFAATDCGSIWQQKHHESSPVVGTGTYASNYPVFSAYCCGFINLYVTKISGYLIMALVSAQDDARARTALTQYFDSWISTNGGLASMQQESTGFYRPRGYTTGRNQWMLSEMAWTMWNSVPGYDSSAFRGLYIKKIMPFYYQSSMNDTNLTGGTSLGATPMPWEGELQNDSYGIRGALMSASMFSGTTEASIMNYWQKTMSGSYSTSVAYNPYTFQSNSQQAHMLFIYTDPSDAGTAPTAYQYIFDQTDLVPNGGPSASVTTCNYDATWTTPIRNGKDCRMNYWVSHSDMGGTGTTVFMQAPWWDGQDHQGDNGQEFGTLEVYRQGFLLSGDSFQADGNNPINRAMIEVGGAANWQQYNDSTGAPSLEVRWAGTHPNGVASNKYTYALNDLGLSYQANVSHAFREVAHLKGGSQDYVILHDRIEAGASVSMKAYFGLYIGPDNFARTNTETHSSWAASKIASVVTANSSLYMAALTVNGANTLAAIVGTNNTSNQMVYLCSSSDGSSCANATTGEWIVVMNPRNNTTPAMGTLTQPSGGANWAIVQIDDGADPKVAAFARGASTQTSLSFTSTHAGTAQYLLAGLTAGTYTVTVAGSPVPESPFTVASGDNTIYFENAAGVVSVAAAASSPSTKVSPGKLNFGGKIVH